MLAFGWGREGGGREWGGGGVRGVGEGRGRGREGLPAEKS